VARLTSDNERHARQLIALYPHPRSALIPILHVLQGQDGYLSADGMEHVGELVGLSAAEVRGTATFYDMFHTEPIGRYLVAVCTNIACMLNGAYELLEHAEERLGVAAGGTTSDGLFTLEDAECLALCGNAPCLTVNWRFFGDVDHGRFDEIVEDLADGRLDDEIPPHGVLSRVPRSNGLAAAGLTVHGAGGPFPRPPGAPAVPPATRPASAAVTVELETSRTTSAVASLDGGREPEAGSGPPPTPATPPTGPTDDTSPTEGGPAPTARTRRGGRKGRS
jgi:NADH-quinone oxidoreductase E subunit